MPRAAYIFTVSHSPYQEYTVGETVLRLCDDLSQASIEEARLEAELLVAHVLGIDRTHLLADLRQLFPPKAAPSLASLVERRRLREPLAYLLGWREFYGLRFAVRPGVLIPRQETETLVEEALRLAVERYGGTPRLADVGCGCGAIAVALAVNLPGAHIYAVDSSPIALRVATENIHSHAVQGWVSLLQGDLLDPVDEPVDLVVANLPYVRTGDFAGIQPEVLREPREALDGGPDGLEVIHRLLRQLAGKVALRGAVLLECDPRQAEHLKREAQAHYAGSSVRVLQDLAGLDRVVELSL